MKKWTALVLSAVIVFGFVASVGANESVLGTYNWTETNMQGVPAPLKGFLELKSGGEFVMQIFEDKQEGTWKLDGEALTLEVDDDPIVAVMKNGVISLDVGDDIVFVFAK